MVGVVSKPTFRTSLQFLILKSRMTHIIASIRGTVLILVAHIAQWRMLETVPQTVYHDICEFRPGFGGLWQCCGDSD